MKSLRTLALGAFLTITAMSAVTFTGCNKDSADCELGYEGKNCATEMRDKFVKSWSASDLTGSTPVVYTAPIVKGTSINAVIIGNFSGDFFSGATINAIISSSTTITIPEQTPNSGGNYKVSGSGELTSGKIFLTYTITQISTGNIQSYTGTWQ